MAGYPRKSDSNLNFKAPTYALLFNLLKLSINFTASVLQQVAPKARDDSNPSAESNRQTIRWTKNTETKLAFIDFNNFHFSKFRASFSNELAFANGRNRSARNCFSWNFEQKKCPQEKPRKSSDWQITSGRLKVPSSELLESSSHKLSPKKGSKLEQF